MAAVNKVKKEKNDSSRFEGDGMNFRAKLIGVDDVAEARGDRMCQLSLQKLKAAVRSAGEHKQRIIVNVSLEGLKIIDGVSMAIQYTHAVHRISFIARDTTDNRAFGYIFGVGDGTHQFFAIKTEKAAEHLVLALRDLFQVVYDMKKQEMEEAKKQQDEVPQPAEGDTQDGQPPPEEGQESIYQVPHSGAVVESPDHIYSGIQQMSSFDEAFSTTDQTQGTSNPWSTPSSPKPGDTSQSSSSGLSDLQQLEEGFNAPPQPRIPIPGQFGVPLQTPGFGAQVPGMAPANPFAPGFGVRSPGPGIMPPAYGTVPQGYPMPRTPMPQEPYQAAAPGFHLPRSPQPRQPVGLPVAKDPFGSDPFSAPGSQPSPGPSVPFGAVPTIQVQPPFPAAFGASQQQAASGSFGFPDTDPDPNILAPVKVGGPAVQEEDLPKQTTRKDAFSDLVDIGKSGDHRKSPKAMFEDLNAPPRKSLNEIKTETQTASLATGAQASDPFGPLDKGAQPEKDINSSADPFDTSFVHIPPPLPVPQYPNSQEKNNVNKQKNVIPEKTKRTKPLVVPGCLKSDKNCERNGTSKIPNGDASGFADDFCLPSPEEPPPPLPAEINFLRSAPAPPPRPDVNVNLPSARPRPVPKPRKSLPKTSSSSSPPKDIEKIAFPDSSADPFSISASHTCNPVHNTDDPFLSTQRNNLDSSSDDKWDAFGSFDHDTFLKDSSGFDSSVPKNGSVSNKAEANTSPFGSNFMVPRTPSPVFPEGK